jgi:hypothetical protein
MHGYNLQSHSSRTDSRSSRGIALSISITLSKSSCSMSNIAPPAPFLASQRNKNLRVPSRVRCAHQSIAIREIGCATSRMCGDTVKMEHYYSPLVFNVVRGMVCHYSTAKLQAEIPTVKMLSVWKHFNRRKAEWQPEDGQLPSRAGCCFSRPSRCLSPLGIQI